MAAFQPMQSSFAFGEMSPRLLGRSDTERYRQSVRLCRDAVTLPHGNFQKRPGTKHVSDPTTENTMRLVSINAASSSPRVLELGYKSGAGYLRLLTRHGYAMNSPNHIADSEFLADNSSWTDASAGTGRIDLSAMGFCRFFPGSTAGNEAILRQQVTVATPASSYDLKLYGYVGTTGSAFTVRVGTTAGATDIATATVGQGESTTAFTPGVATFWIEIEVDETYTEEKPALEYVSLILTSAAVYEVATPWSEIDLENLTYAEATNAVSVYFTVGTTYPQVFTIVSDGSYTFGNVAFSTAPSGIGAGNYPISVTIHDQRLWFGGSPNAPDTLWGSKTNDFVNFNLGTGVATDSIKFEMSDRGTIKWIRGAKDLLVGTDVAEYVISGSGGVIIPGDIGADQQSAYGSFLQTVSEVGNGVLYVANDQRRVRFMSYQFVDDGWISLDLTWPSEHLTKPLIKEMHFRYSPDPYIWFVMEDGTALSAVYEREQDNLVGWHKHTITGADVQSIALTKLGASIEVWFASKRTINGSTHFCIERTSAPSDFFEGWYGDPTIFMDNTLVGFVSLSGGVPQVTGLNELEGETVQVVVGGAVHQPTTIASGTVVLQPDFAKEGQVAWVGLGFTGKVRTLPLEGINRGGTAQAVKKRRSRVFVRMNESTLPLVNGEESSAREPMDPMDEGVPRFTGDAQYTVLGWDRFAEVEFTMPKPKHYDIAALFGDAAAGSL